MRCAGLNKGQELLILVDYLSLMLTFIPKSIQSLFKQNITASLTLLTGLGYFATYEYERGACNFYKIPSSFIEIGVSNVLLFSSAIVIVILIVMMIARFVLVELQSFKYPILGILLSYNLKTVPLGLFVIYLEPDQYLIWIWMFVGITIFNNVSIYRHHWNREKAIRKEEVEITKAEPNLKKSLLRTKALAKLSDAKNDNGKTLDLLKFTIPLFLIVAIPTYTFTTGYSMASKEDKYLVLSEKPNVVLLKKYGDTYIFREYKKHSLLNKIFVIKQSPTYPLNLKDTTIRFAKVNRSKWVLF